MKQFCFSKEMLKNKTSESKNVFPFSQPGKDILVFNLSFL